MLDKRVVKFIGRHHVMTLATTSEQGAYCATLFYAYSAEKNIFLFASDGNTRHAADFLADARVAASIHLESKVVGKLQGLQITGEIKAAEGDEKKVYFSSYPYAAVMPNVELWVLTPQMMKLTDNRLGFGKKLIWNAE